MELILASASPRRKELLQRITKDFSVYATDVDESLPSTIPPMNAAEILAQKKALAAIPRYPNACIIGCDTTVVLGGIIFGKPKTPQHAVDMLRSLSGKTHQVITGVALAHGTSLYTFHTKTDVTFYDLTDAQIQAYIATGEPLDKAGGYGIQGFGALLVQKIDGDYFSVVGLPIAPLARALEQFSKQIEEKQKGDQL